MRLAKIERINSNNLISINWQVLRLARDNVEKLLPLANLFVLTQQLSKRQAKFLSMIHHLDISSQAVHSAIKHHLICLGGNRKLKIYGTLSCFTGKRMKRENRVFFASEREAIQNGYRPCGHCMKKKYQHWKNGIIS